MIEHQVERSQWSCEGDIILSEAFGWMKSLGWRLSCLRRPSWTSSSSSLFSEPPSSFRSFQERLLSDNDKDPLKLSPDDSDSLSDLLSSPERYAFSLNMTLEEVEHQKEVYQNASQSLQERLEKLDNNADTSNILSPSALGKRKHEMICEHRLKYGRHPFVCSKCWSYLPICICHLAKYVVRPENEESPKAVQQQWQYPNLQVLVWTHHREWGLTSNTGSILALTLGNYDDDSSNSDGSTTTTTITSDRKNPCRMLMKGFPKHDEILQDILDSANKKSNHDEVDCPLVVVLWPSSSSLDNDTITISELREALEITESTSGSDDANNPQTTVSSPPTRRKQVVLLAVDGTWRNARRMVAKLPPHVKRLDLDEHALRWNDDDMQNINVEEDLVSILAPLRKRGPSGKENNQRMLSSLATDDLSSLVTHSNETRQVCTAEAVVAALYGLQAIDTKLAQHVLSVTQTKVDRVRRYRGKVQ